MGLKAKQARFAQEYPIDLNATQAAIRAGYSEKTARSQGQRLLTNADVQSRIQEYKLERQKEAKYDAAMVLKRHIEIDQMDIGDILKDDGSLKPISQWPKVWRTSISGLDIVELMSRGDDREALDSWVKKIKWPDKLKNLELLGKHVDVSAYGESKQGGESVADALAALADRLPQ